MDRIENIKSIKIYFNDEIEIEIEREDIEVIILKYEEIEKINEFAKFLNMFNLYSKTSFKFS